MSNAIEGEIVNSPTSVVLTKHPEEKVQLLEAAFNYDFNITEACQYAGISRETYYSWMEDDPIFAARINIAKSAPMKLAKEMVIKAIQSGDPQIALRYLTLRDPDFKPKAAVEFDPGEKRTEEKLKEFMDDTDDGAYPDTAREDAVSAEPTAPPESEGGAEVAPSTTDIHE